MQYRHIRKNEYNNILNNMTTAFNYTVSTEDAEKWQQEDFEGYKMWWGAFQEDGVMSSCLGVNELEMAFDGQYYPMGGIGGVNTLPPYRRSGDIRMLFRAVCEEMRERKIPFSYLYPFSHNYYRQYGYELVNVTHQVEAPTAELRAYRGKGSARQYKPGEDITPFRAIEEAYTIRMNGMVHRTEEGLRALLGKDSMFTGDRAYLVYNDAGQPAAWVAYTVENGSVLVVKEMQWKDKEGLACLLSLFSNYEGNLPTVRFRCPPELEPNLWWPESYSVKMTTVYNGMLRIILAEEALRGLQKPAGAGKVVLEIKDDFCPWNADIYRVEWQNGQSEVTRTGEAPDMTCDIRAMNQLIFGTFNWQQMLSRRNLEVHNSAAPLAALFPKKNVEIQVHF